MRAGARNGLRDRVAFAAAATTGYTACNTPRSQASYAAEASLAAIEAAGIDRREIDGVCGSPILPAWDVVSMLGLDDVTWFVNTDAPFVNQVSASAAALAAGLCEVVLTCHTPYRVPANTSRAGLDPLRTVPGLGYDMRPATPESIVGPLGYTAWASWYLHHYGLGTDGFARVAVNSRTNARENPNAALREPMTFADYERSPMVRAPLRLLDMDVAADGADAFILTTAERARDLRLPPVLIDAVTLGLTARNGEEEIDGWHRHGQHVAVEALRTRAGFWLDDIDLLQVYDGFTPITLAWLENVGYCGPGEAPEFLAEHWDDQGQRLLIDGRIPLNTHGGNLSEGASQGSGHLREAVQQLQGRCGPRQVPDAERALLLCGGFFFNAQCLTLYSSAGDP